MTIRLSVADLARFQAQGRIIHCSAGGGKTAAQAAARGKYGSIRTAGKLRTFDSKGEAEYAAYLDLLVKAGQVNYYLMQVPFHLPGRVKYVCDFLVFYKDGTHSYLDFKGALTRSFIDKRKLVEALFIGVRIHTVSRDGRGFRIIVSSPRGEDLSAATGPLKLSRK